MDLAEIQQAIHIKYLDLLALYRYSQSDIFTQAYWLANQDQKLVARDLIKSENKEGLIEWSENQLAKNKAFEGLPIKSLRKIAQEFGIKNYSVSSKEYLISELYQYDKSNTTTASRNEKVNA